MDRDCIKIEGLKVFARHGVYDEEKKNGQYFYIDAEMYLSLHNAGASDELSQTVNYAEVAGFILCFVTENRFDLIERLAEKLAEELLLKYQKVDEVRICVHKPNAPIIAEFKDVSVNITRKWHTVFLSVGSNMGDKEVNISEALCKLKQNSRIKDVRESKRIITKPYGGVTQDDFLNLAVGLKTLYYPEELLDYLHELESEAGRERIVHWGPRTLDLDIVFYDDLVMSTDELTIPHADMSNREFVLEPLMELCPNYVNQQLGLSVREMYERLKK